MAGAVCATPYVQKLHHILTKSGGPNSFCSKKTFCDYINVERGIKYIQYKLFSVYNELYMR